ncbi:MAG: hypothetical protein JWQ28_2156, partial [Pedobacter sp.]|nr:hypothetical protein [Pedobacter sp.]
MDSNQNLLSRISQLEKENSELKVARAGMKAEVEALTFEDDQTIFKTIFESSRLGNKV